MSWLPSAQNPGGALIALRAASITHFSMIPKKLPTNTQPLSKRVEDKTQPTPEPQEGQYYLVTQQNKPAIDCRPNDKMLGFHIQEARFKSEITALESLSGPLNTNLRWAHRAVAHVRGKLIHGSNALPDAKLSREQGVLLRKQMQAEFNNRLMDSMKKKEIPYSPELDDEMRPAFRLKTKDVAKVQNDLLEKYGFGVCSDQAAAAYCYLLDEVPAGTCVEIGDCIGGDHVLVVIGRDPQSNPLDRRTWGPHAVVCDPWANEVYALSKVAEMQRPEKDVKRHIGANDRHYLAGQLQIRGEWHVVSIR